MARTARYPIKYDKPGQISIRQYTFGDYELTHNPDTGNYHIDRVSTPEAPTVHVVRDWRNALHIARHPRVM